SRTTVPGGTWRTRSSPSRPWQLAPWPRSPVVALQCLRWDSAARLSTPSWATSVMLPPRPPSPPSGPPLGTYFSRRKLTHPSPPRPASSWISTRSTNMDGRQDYDSRGRGDRLLRRLLECRRRFSSGQVEPTSQAHSVCLLLAIANLVAIGA